MAGLRKKLNDYNREHKKFKTQFFRDTAEVEIDGSGRILLPRKFMESMELDKDVVLAGMDKVIEIWDKKSYDENQMDGDDFANLAEKILGNETMMNEIL